MIRRISLIIGITLFTLIICATYSINFSNIQVSNNESRIGEITYKGEFPMPVENFNVVTSKYGERIHPITRIAKFSYRY